MPNALVEFERELQQIVSGALKIHINYNTPDAAGVFFHGVYLGVVIPVNGPKPFRDPNYTDVNGVIWRSKPEIVDLVKAKMRVMSPEKFDLIKHG